MSLYTGKRQIGNYISNRKFLCFASSPTAGPARILMNRSQAITHRSPTTQNLLTIGMVNDMYSEIDYDWPTKAAWGQMDP